MLFCFALELLITLCCFYFFFTVFETIPQAVLQSLLLFSGAFGSNISEVDVYISIASAVLNSIFQVLRLRLESIACHESFVEYCLQCLLARISWIPFYKDFTNLLTKGNTNNNMNGGSNGLNYNIRYSLPCGLSKYLSFKPKVDYDFSSATIQELINTMEITRGTSTDTTNSVSTAPTTTIARQESVGISRGGTFLSDENNDSNGNNNNGKIQINFGKSLRLLGFQDLFALFEACSNKEIKITGMSEESIYRLVTNAINISYHNKEDVRLLSNCKNEFGQSYLSVALSLSKSLNEGLIGSIISCLCNNEFNMNVTNKSNGETIIFDLIRNFDKTNLLNIMNTFVQQNDNKLFLNYHNMSGISPLYTAITNFKREKKLFGKIGGKDDFQDTDYEYMYQVLINNNVANASVNFPVAEQIVDPHNHNNNQSNNSNNNPKQNNTRNVMKSISLHSTVKA